MIKTENTKNESNQEVFASYVRQPDKVLFMNITIDKENMRIFLKHSIDSQIWSELKAIPKAWWQREKKQWIFAGNNQNYLKIVQIANNNNCVIKKELRKTIDEKETNPVVKRYIETMQMTKNSLNTIEAYLPYFKKFVAHFKDVDIESLGFKEIAHYIENVLKYSDSETEKRHLICAIKYYYENLLGRDKMIFHLRQPKAITNAAFVLPIDKLLPLLTTINEPRNKLLFLLKFGFGKNETKLAGVSLVKFKEWLINDVFIEYNNEKHQICSLVKEYYLKYKTTEYLFEKTNATMFTPVEIGQIVQAAIMQHNFIEPFNTTLQKILTSAGFKYKTQKCYCNSLLQFIKAFNYRNFEDISNEEIRGFLHGLSKNNKISTSTINQYINALKFFYIDVLKRDIPFNLFYRPKTPSLLPKVLSPEHIGALLENITNLKHKCIIAVEYSAGLRISEVLDLKVSQLNYEKGEICIFAQKGQKERITLLASNLKEWLKDYIEQYKPKDYLFEGATGGRYSETSVGNILKAALKKAGIQEKATNHWLRHSFATDLLEHGTDITYIKDLLGHKDIKTTLRYTHVADNKRRTIVSPLDRINITKKTIPGKEDKNTA